LSDPRWTANSAYGTLKDMARLLAIIAVLLAFTASPAVAQDKLGIRAGAHEEYSRLVFDWPAHVGYTVTASGTEVTIAFDKGASMDQSAIKGDNVKGAKIVSADPLKITITIPQGSTTRDFYTGDRVVLDIYNPPGAAPNKVAEAPKAAPKKEEPKKAEPKKEEVKTAAKPVEEKPLEKPEEKKPEAAPSAVKETAAAPPEQEALRSAEEPFVEPHVITVTSTQSVGVAAFENYGELWLVADQDEYYLKPQINGPTPEIFPEFKEAKIALGKAYATKIPPGAIARGQGGGLLWRLVVASDQDPKPAPEPERKFTGEAGGPRGGTLVWKFREAGKIMDFKDPVSGSTLKIVTTENSRDYGGPARDFIDFEVLESHIGLIIRPKVDDLQISLIQDGVQVTRPGGLAIMPEEKLTQGRKKRVTPPVPGAEPTQEQASPRIFSFAEWQMGGIEVMNQNETVLLSGLHEKPEGEKYQDLITLARMHLSNGHGAEALGYLSYAMGDLEGLETNPDFLALRGVANALDWKTEDAFRDLSIEDLKPFPEVQYWRAYALADLGDWDQAYKILPNEIDALYDYPHELRTPLALVLAEIALRGGNTALGKELLELVEQYQANLKEHQKAGLQYLKGEANRQEGFNEESVKLWQPLTKGKDEWFRAKAGLALTQLLYEEGDMDMAHAVDSLERLRYAWRGDELEASINYKLGRIYFDNGEYVKGLSVMRDAASYAPGTNLGKRISVEMMESFVDLFTGPNLAKVSPQDAVTLYEQFAELTPAGETGNQVVQALAEHLVQADLLTRAGDLLQQLIEQRLTGDAAAKVAVRLAAIRLIDRQPQKALEMLDRATAALRGLPEDVAIPARFHEISLLRARAYLQTKKPDQALALLNGLEPNRDVNRLKADVAWQAGYWDDAAEALEQVILDEDISLTRPLREEHATLILNRAIALNLASDRIALTNMREKFADSMAQTDKARLFEVVTRPRQNAALADRETLKGIVSEVDLFSDFLNAYKGSPAPSN
jgi:tetratricopeptide (TPR) repeat protein